MSAEIKQFAEVLRAQIRSDMNDFADDMANGACTSFDEYKRLCGVIHGLARAEGYLLGLLEKADTDE